MVGEVDQVTNETLELGHDSKDKGFIDCTVRFRLTRGGDLCDQRQVSTRR
jgi:hypothetical protein